MAKPLKKAAIKNIVHQSFFELCNSFNYLDKDIRIDLYLVEKIANRCVLDFEKITLRHDIGVPDSHKITGYLTYWICKMSPIIIVNDKLYDQEMNHFLNQILGIMTSIFVINKEKEIRAKYGKGINNNKIELKDLSNIFLDYLYTLTFCNINPDLLSMIHYYFDVTAGQAAKQLSLSS